MTPLDTTPAPPPVVRPARRRRPPVRATVLPGATRVAWVLAEAEMAELFDVEAGR